MRMSLEQLEFFVTAASSGSFSGAARRLGKAQSAVSTAIANLELELGLRLFDRSARYPTLTREGEALLADARTILSRCTSFEDRAAGFAQKTDAKLRVACDEIISFTFTAELLGDFAERFPETELELLFGSLGDVEELVQEGRADLGLLVPLRHPAKTLEARHLGPMPFLPVVSSEHPLAQRKSVTRDELSEHRQLCIITRGGEREPEATLLGGRPWMIDSNYAIHDLVRRGLGFAFLPVHMIRHDLRAGRLVPVPVPLDGLPLEVPIYLIWPPAQGFGLAGTWLMDAMADVNTDDH